jgi:hypothetical protein
MVESANKNRNAGGHEELNIATGCTATKEEEVVVADHQPEVEAAVTRTCPLHKVIRSRRWERVHDMVDRDPKTVRQCNRHGWSSLLLAIYHRAPDWILQSMIQSQSSSPRDRSELLSRALPNGRRLCLHFAARYSDDLHIIQQLVTAYPPALLLRSDDGGTALDRAKFYQKDTAIIDYLQRATTAEQDRVDLLSYNRTLRATVVWCCSLLNANNSKDDNDDNNNGNGNEDNDDDNNNIVFVSRLYQHAKEREMPGLFRTVLDYVGVHRLPPTTGTTNTGTTL